MQISLPVDITWKRLASSHDMTAYMKKDQLVLPPRWRSSLAIFYSDAEPTDTNSDRIITFIKVITTITGYQLGEEIGYDFSPPATSETFSEEITETIDITEERLPSHFHTDPAKRAREFMHVRKIISLKDSQVLSSTPSQIAKSLKVKHGKLNRPPKVIIDSDKIIVSIWASMDEPFRATFSYKVNTVVTSFGSVPEKKLWDDTMKSFRPCHGAMLQMVVLPGPNDGSVTFPNYPYITAFEPKKRELFETVTESGETLSGSSSNLNVKKGATSTNQLEEADIITGESFSAGANLTVKGTGGGVNASYSKSGEQGTRTKAGTENVNITTADASREKRETQSSTTSLSQVYTQLQSYHLGTNRALFLMSPRPHLKQSFTFVRGTRELEGIQEFFFITSRPKSVKGLCIRAILETGHVIEPTSKSSEPLGDLEYEDKTITAFIDEVIQVPKGKIRGETFITDFSIPSKWKVDREQDTPVEIDTTGYIGTWLLGNIPKPIWTTDSEVSYNDNDDISKIRLRVTFPEDYRGEAFDVPFKANVTIKCKSSEPIIGNTEKDDSNERHFVMTGRQLQGCIKSTTADGSLSEEESEPMGDKSELNEVNSLIYQSKIPIAHDRLSDFKDKDKIQNAVINSKMRSSNLMIEAVKRQMINSLESPDRHALGQFAIAESGYIKDNFAQFAANLPNNHPKNKSLNMSDRSIRNAAMQLKKMKITKISELAKNLDAVKESVRDDATKIALEKLVFSSMGIVPKASKSVKKVVRKNTLSRRRTTRVRKIYRNKLNFTK